MQRPYAFPMGPNVPRLDAAMRRAGAATRTAQAIGLEWLDYAKQSGEDLTAAMKRIAAARTPAETFAIQGAFLREAAERLSARSSVLGGLYVQLAADLTHPGSGVGTARPTGAR